MIITREPNHPILYQQLAYWYGSEICEITSNGVQKRLVREDRKVEWGVCTDPDWTNKSFIQFCKKKFACEYANKRSFDPVLLQEYLVTELITRSHEKIAFQNKGTVETQVLQGEECERYLDVLARSVNALVQEEFKGVLPSLDDKRLLFRCVKLLDQLKKQEACRWVRARVGHLFVEEWVTNGLRKSYEPSFKFKEPIQKELVDRGFAKESIDHGVLRAFYGEMGRRYEVVLRSCPEDYKALVRDQSIFLIVNQALKQRSAVSSLQRGGSPITEEDLQEEVSQATEEIIPKILSAPQMRQLFSSERHLKDTVHEEVERMSQYNEWKRTVPYGPVDDYEAPVKTERENVSSRDGNLLPRLNLSMLSEQAQFAEEDQELPPRSREDRPPRMYAQKEAPFAFPRMQVGVPSLADPPI